jgi:hypothetical protein
MGLLLVLVPVLIGCAGDRRAGEYALDFLGEERVLVAEVLRGLEYYDQGVFFF